MKLVYGTLAILIVTGIGAWWYTERDIPMEPTVPNDLGSYFYICSNNVAFTMIPGNDVSSIRIRPGTNAQFAEAVLLQDPPTDRNRFTNGTITLIGAGERITLEEAGRTHLCEPVPNDASAPFNFGDRVESSVSPMTADAVQQSLVGVWRSIDDPRFTREFTIDGSVIDAYDTVRDRAAAWMVFIGALHAAAPYMFIDGHPYILISNGITAEDLYFSVEQITDETLELMYLARGTMLRFERIN